MPALILALIGLLGFALLPGLGLFQRKRPVIEQLGSAIAVSVAANSFVIMLLALCGAYTRFSAWVWLVLALGIAGWLRKQRVWFRSQLGGSPPAGASAGSTLLLLPVLGVVAYKSFVLPFFAWDSIASWNRWARAFALDPDFFSSTRFFHPQYLSWGMSFPYVLSADPSQEWSGHGLALFCFLIFWAGVWRLSSALCVPPALACTAVMVPLAVSSYAGTGYSDIAASGFSCLALALMLDAFAVAGKRGSTIFRNRARNRALLAGLAAGTAFHYKLLAPLAWGGLLLGLVLGVRRVDVTGRLRLALVSSAAFLFVIGPWLLSTRAALTDPLLHYVTTGIHGELSRTEILSEGAGMFLAGATAFRGLGVDILVLLLGAVFFLVGCMKGREATALGVSACFGAVVWMATANYDTRALMPFQTVAVVLGLGGLEKTLMGVGSRHLRQALLPVLQTTFLFSYLFPQFAPDWRFRSARVIDWQPGRHWVQAPPWGGRTAQLKVLQPALASLAEWRSDHPTVGGTLWANPLLLADLDPTQSDESLQWMGQLEWQGKVQWNGGDLLLVCDFDRDTPKLEYPVIDRLAGSSASTWGPWIAAAEKEGVVGLQFDYTALKIYEIRARPSDTAVGPAAKQPQR